MGIKNWIMIKRGLSEDPKHRAAMGVRVWLFMHIIDRANWDTGIVPEWRDQQEADDMEMPWRTLQEQRQALEELGYITCMKHRDSQSIIIHEWVNPRNYSGGVLNSRQQGTESSVLLDSKSTGKSTGKSSRKPRTPSIRDQGSGDQGSGKAAEPRPPRAPKPRDPLLDHPAVKTYRDIMHLTPNEAQRKAISEAVTDDRLGKWSDTLQNWTLHGWKPGNVAGQLESLQNGAKNGTHRNSNPQDPERQERLQRLADAINQRRRERAEAARVGGGS